MEGLPVIRTRQLRMHTSADDPRALAALTRPHSFVLIAFLFAGSSCFKTELKPEPPNLRERRNAHINRDIWTASLTGMMVGRVSLDGEPVSYFGVTVHANHRFFGSPAPIPVRASDGRFLVKVPPGEWDLIFAGPGFARHVVKKVNVRAGEANVPLQVRVGRGDTVQGLVTNTMGDAVEGAVVEISQNLKTPTRDLLWELARGNFTAVTNAGGMFRFDNVASVAGHASISASLPGVGVSQSQSVPSGNSSISLVLSPVGTIAGALTTRPLPSPGGRPEYLAVARLVKGAASSFSAAVANDGTFQINDVPEGEYDIGLLSTDGAQIPGSTSRVLVTAGQPVKVLLRLLP